MKPIIVIIPGIVLVMSLISLFLMYYDKRCAKEGKRRIPEKTLFLFAALFGALGGTAGMWIFRHKTKHWYFAVFFPVMMIIQVAAAGYAIARLM